MSDVTDVSIVFLIGLLGLAFLFYVFTFAFVYEKHRRLWAYIRYTDREDECLKWMREQKVLYE